MEQAEGPKLSVKHSTDRFDAADIGRMLSESKTLLEGVAPTRKRARQSCPSRRSLSTAAARKTFPKSPELSYNPASANRGDGSHNS